MKVSSTMFGRPGKCVACRQKIRIPRMDEIPQDVTEIYLKDYPEFLRKPAAAPRFSEVERAQADAAAPDDSDDGEDVSLGDASGEGPAIPLEPLEPLQVLCSLEEKIQRQLDKARKAPAKSSGDDKATLVRYRTLTRNARSAFDDRLRDRLVEATEQLNQVKESLARAAMAMRVGEMQYEAYQEKARPLRVQRDRLERRLQNLRGWLATSDPALAGGYIDVRLEDVPVEPEEVALPLEPRATAALLYEHMEELRNAMRERAGAERKLAEWQRIERERALAPAEIETGRRESEAIRQRAGAAVAFSRGRLEQAAQDTEQDNKAIRSYLDTLRGRLQGGEIDANVYKATESRLLTAQNDNVNARELARRALAANAPGDIPRPSSTLMQRLAAANTPSGLGLDSWIAWAAALLLAAAIFVPIARFQLGSNLAEAPGLAMGLFIGAGAIAMIALVPRRPVRGGLLNIAWVLLCVAGAAYIHESRFSAAPFGVALRSDPGWFNSPGIVLLALCGMASGLAASVSVLPVRELRRAPGIAAGVIIITLSLILTDLFGMLTASPVVQEPSPVISTEREGEYDVRIELGNTGWRPLQLGGDPLLSPSAVTFLLERRVGADSWEDLTVRNLIREKLTGQLGGEATRFPNIQLAGGQRVEVTYHLTPGNYRAHVQYAGDPERTRERTRVRNFTLTEIQGSTGLAGAAAPDAAAPGPRPVALDPAPSDPAPADDATAAQDTVEEPAAGPVTAPAPAEGITVELQGVINAAGRDPRFIVILSVPGEEPSRMYTALGETIAGAWKTAEFNPETQTLTLNDGQKLLVLERGVSMPLGPSALAPARPDADAEGTGAPVETPAQ